MSHRKNRSSTEVSAENSQETKEITYIIKKCENQGGTADLSSKKSETIVLIKHFFEILSLIFVALGGFIVVMYLKPITAQDDQTTHNFNQAVSYIRNIQQDADWLRTACTVPINFSKAEQYQTDLGRQNVELVHDVHDKLGLLVSPQTYCNLRKVAVVVEKSVNSKNPCDNIPQSSNQQINKLISQINFDKSNFNSYIEFFKKNRDKTHDDSICDKINK